MNERKQSLVVLIGVCLMALVGMPLLWLAVVAGDVIDLSIEGANPVRQAQIGLAFLYWLCAGTALVLLTSGICYRLGKEQEAEKAPSAATEAAAPQTSDRRTGRRTGGPRLPLGGGALPRQSG